MSEKPKLETVALHGGNYVDETMARSVPLHRTSAYLFRDAEHAADLFALKEMGNIYTRLMNPTQDVLEKRVAAMENGAAALALSSGTSGVYYSVINICRDGNEIVSSKNIYGGTYTMFNDILPDYGIKTSFVDVNNHDEVRGAINENTRMVFTEVIGNPALDVTNIKALATLAAEYNLPLVVDSTFTTPYLFNPLDHGADIVIHSLTKWLGGHGTGIGGIVVDSGKFNWKDEKFDLYNREEKSYGGLRFAHDLGDLSPLAFILRMRLVPLRNLGACISPDNAWQFLQGIETLHLRVQRHCDNAIALAEYLVNHPAVSWVRYPGLKSDPSYPLAEKQFRNGFGGMVVFGVKGGREKGERFINRLRLVSHLANVGDAKSLAIHPASTTHSQLSDDALKACGIPADMVRISVGIEHIDDIIADIDQGLKD